MPEKVSKGGVGNDDGIGEGRRLDLWLWYARFFKSRTLATRFCQSGKLRVNGGIVKKAHHLLRVGDVLTFSKARDVQVIKVVDMGTRRGPATEAQTLYEDLSPPVPSSGKSRKPKAPVSGLRDQGSGRPTKRQRREFDKLRGI